MTLVNSAERNRGLKWFAEIGGVQQGPLADVVTQRALRGIQWSLGTRVQGLGFMVQGPGFRV